MAECEAHWFAHRFELSTCCEHVLPRLREDINPGLLEKIFAIAHRNRRKKVGHGTPHAIHHTLLPGKVIPAAIGMAHLGAYVTDIHQHIRMRVSEEIRTFDN